MERSRQRSFGMSELMGQFINTHVCTHFPYNSNLKQIKQLEKYGNSNLRRSVSITYNVNLSYKFYRIHSMYINNTVSFTDLGMLNLPMVVRF
jgi:hypothetical protein